MKDFNHRFCGGIPHQAIALGTVVPMRDLPADLVAAEGDGVDGGAVVDPLRSRDLCRRYGSSLTSHAAGGDDERKVRKLEILAHVFDKIHNIGFVFCSELFVTSIVPASNITTLRRKNFMKQAS